MAHVAQAEKWGSYIICWRRTDGGVPDGEDKCSNVCTFCLGPLIALKASFGVEMGGTSAENHEESENRVPNCRKSYNKDISGF